MKAKTVLLVEDNPDDEALTIRAFKKAQINSQLVIVRDGSEALDYLFCVGDYSSRDPKDMPQVVLLDLQLPKVNGLEVLHKLRADDRTKVLPIIILTSSQEERELVASYNGGANSYIVKPVEPAPFTECIQQLGLYWLFLNEYMPKKGKP